MKLLAEVEKWLKFPQITVPHSVPEKESHFIFIEFTR